MENEPSIRINLGEQKFEMTRENSFLYTFLGRAALYNHIFLKRDDLPQREDGNITGTYLFKGIMPDNGIFDRIAEKMHEGEFPLYLNQPRVSQCDVDAYMSAVMKDLEGDSFPEDWVK